MTDSEPKRDWYAVGWLRGVEAAQRAVAHATDLLDALDRLEELKQPATGDSWKGRRHTQ